MLGRTVEKELYFELYNRLKEQEKEIERLNNIIDELEKFMDEDYEYYEKYGHAEQGHAMGQIRRIKNKLQKLKHKKIYGSVDSEILYYDELGSVSNE